MENRLKYIEEVNCAMFLLWLAGYYFNNTKIAMIAVLGVMIGLGVNVFNCFTLSKIAGNERKIHNILHIINQMLMAVGLITLYFIARW